MDKGTLLPEEVMMQPLSIEDARRKFVGCVKGLLHLHRHEVVYGNIKLQNMLVAADGTVKIADFGAALVLHHEVDVFMKWFHRVFSIDVFHYTRFHHQCSSL